LTNSDYLLALIGAFMGALGNGLAGWWDSNEPFDWRKFMGSVWRAIFSAMTIALGYDKIQGLQQLGMFTFIAAFLLGAGVESFGNKLQGGINNRTPDSATKLAKIQSQILEIEKARNSADNKGVTKNGD
jgi:hypothetical protein